MKLKTAIKRLEQDFGMVGIDHRIKTWEMYQPTEFWLFTDKYFISVLPNEFYSTNKGFYLQNSEFAKEQVNELATSQKYIRIAVTPRDGRLNLKPFKFRIKNAQGFQNVLEKLDNDPSYSFEGRERV